MSAFLPEASKIMEIRPEIVAKWIHLPRNERPRLIDCREEDERVVCQIAGNEWIPLGLFPEKKDLLQIGNERGVVTYCHHGVRSMRAVHFLRSIGVENAFSLAGGIEAWSDLIDPRVPKY